MNLTVIVLTFNSESSLPGVIKSCEGLASRILVVDSNSTDDTCGKAGTMGCEVVSHPFDDYASQRNWAQDYAGLADDEWVLHLDSDEELSPELRDAIRRVIEQNDPAIRGYLIRRLTHFWGKPIRHGHMNPGWHLRLYRAGSGQCENRLYDQHFICSGPTAKLKGLLLDMQSVTLERWTATHNRWSTLEASEAVAPKTSANDTLRGNLAGDRRERKRWLKNRIWYRAPRFWRVYVFFLYSYVLKGGFLDGRTGFVYHTLQAFWFRFLVDAKIEEIQRSRLTCQSVSSSAAQDALDQPNRVASQGMGDQNEAPQTGRNGPQLRSKPDAVSEPH